MEKDVEHEIKLALSGKAIEQAYNLFKDNYQVEEKEVSLHRVYFDTVDLKLKEQDISVRVEPAKDNKFEQTIKMRMNEDNSEDGEFKRKEWVNIIDASIPNIECVESELAVKALSGINFIDLKPIFISKINRKYFDISINDNDKGDSLLELAFDTGKICLVGSDDNISQPISEIEAELKSGNSEALLMIKNKILKAFPDATACNLTKSCRGYQLYQS